MGSWIWIKFATPSYSIRDINDNWLNSNMDYDETDSDSNSNIDDYNYNNNY